MGDKDCHSLECNHTTSSPEFELDLDLGLFAGEVSRLFITGWDLLFIYIAYGFVFCILLGAGIMLIILKIRNRKMI